MGSDRTDGARGWRGAKAKRVGRRALLVAGVVVGSSSLGSAQASAQLLPPAGDYTVRWYQPAGSLVIRNWQIEISAAGRPAYVVDALAVPEPACWSVNVPVSQPSVVRLRAVSGSLTSAWTRPTAVPEPTASVAAAAAVGSLVGLARKRARRRAGASR